MRLPKHFSSNGHVRATMVDLRYPVLVRVASSRGNPGDKSGGIALLTDTIQNGLDMNGI